MLAINGKPMESWASSDPLIKHIKSALNKIQTKKFWKLVFHESKIISREQSDGGILYESSGGLLQQATGKYVFNGMEHDITYYTNVINTRDGKKYSPEYLDFSGPLPLDPKRETDLIFYLTCVSPACAPYDLIEKFQYIRPNANYFYKVEDVFVDAAVSNIMKRKVAKISYLIYDDDLALDERTLRNVAVNFKIPNAMGIELEILRNKLGNTVLRQKNGVYDEVRIDQFLELIENDDLLKIRSMINIAIEKEFVKTDRVPKTGNLAWYLYRSDGKKGERIVTFSLGTDPTVTLIRHFINNPREFSSFEKFVESGGLLNDKIDKDLAGPILIESVKENKSNKRTGG